MSKIKTNNIGKSSFRVNQLQFADDTLLFSTMEAKVLENLCDLNQVFEKA